MIFNCQHARFQRCKGQCSLTLKFERIVACNFMPYQTFQIKAVEKRNLGELEGASVESPQLQRQLTSRAHHHHNHVAPLLI
jgi:hypothetical protein